MLSYFSSASSIMRSLVAKGFFLRARRDCAVRPGHGETREHCAAGSLAAEEGGRGLVELARLLPAPLWRRRPVHARPAAIAAHQPGVHHELPASRSYIKLSACPAAPVYQLCVSDARAGPGHSRQRRRPGKGKGKGKGKGFTPRQGLKRQGRRCRLCPGPWRGLKPLPRQVCPRRFKPCPAPVDVSCW